MEILNQTFFSVFRYPLSILELVGVLTGFAAVILASKARAVNFLFGIVNAIAYFILYFEYRLYSMMLLQLVYFTFSIYGYYNWKHPVAKEADKNHELRIRFLSVKEILIWLSVIAVAGVAWGWSVIHLQIRFPEFFDPPAYPWLDAVLTMASVVGQWLLSKKIWENWILWIFVDVISVVLFATMGMVFTAVLYTLFTLIALKALIDWKKIYETYNR